MEDKKVKKGGKKNKQEDDLADQNEITFGGSN
jgi:hypothetical protein